MLLPRIVNGIIGGGQFLVLAAAVMYRSWWPVVLFVACALVAHSLILLFSPLQPLSDVGVGAAKSARMREVGFALLAIGLISALVLLTH